MREDCPKRQARVAIEKNINEITRKCNETIQAAALRLNTAPDYSAEGCNRPGPPRGLFFWGGVVKRGLDT